MTHNPISSDAPTPEVGQRIRLLREARDLSLRALAERCGLSVNAISRIERGENSPTVSSLHLLATALNVPITEFFHTNIERSIVYVKHDQRTRSQQSGMDIESLGLGLHNQQIEPFLVTLQPQAQTENPLITHSGQEFVYCVEGQIEYQVGGEVFTLTGGDSLLFEATQAHRFCNRSAQPAVILMIFQTREGKTGFSQSHLNPGAG